MIPIVDLFHQQIMDDPDYMVLADYTGVHPQYKVYWKTTCEVVGMTNCRYPLPQCRLLINDHLRRIGRPVRQWAVRKSSY